MNTGRSYRLGARADSMRETRERILESARTAVLTKYYDEYTLQEIASEASVTVQTVLRHFGSKEGLLSAVKDHFASVITSRMDTVPVGDVREAITVLYDRYEWMGDGNCRLMAQEERVEPIADWVRDARANPPRVGGAHLRAISSRAQIRSAKFDCFSSSSCATCIPGSC